MAARGSRLRYKCAMSSRRRAAIWIGLALLLALAVILWRRPDAPRQQPAPAVAQQAGAPPPAAAVRPAVRAPPPSPAAVAPARPASIERVRGQGAIEGAVVSASTGAGIDGAELTFQRDDGAFSVRSGSGGAFSFEVAKGGRHRL